MTDPYPSISFDNTEVAYQPLSDSELKKSYWLFRLMSYPRLVSVGNFFITWLLRFHFPIHGLIRHTIYRQFCGGETLQETIPLIRRLHDNKIEVLLNYSVEGLHSAEAYRDTYDRTMEAILFAEQYPSVRAICIKFTGYAHTDIWTKIQQHQPLNTAEQEEYNQAKVYIDALCSQAVKSQVQLFVDAEESWFQDSIDALVDDMMEKYNRTQCTVFNTYQLYRSDKLADIELQIERARQKNYILGAKIVRGAYVEKENDYYQHLSEPSPINPTKEASDTEFNQALSLILQHIDQVSLCCASHNEYSNKLLLELLHQHQIPLNHPHVNSSQLLGMSDNITYNLHEAGINTAKYVPFGPINDVVPYLIRRAQENTSVEGQTSRELLLLQREMKRRGL